MKNLDTFNLIVPFKMFFCPNNHSIFGTSDYMGKGFLFRNLKEIDTNSEMEDIYHCIRCNKLYKISELKIPYSQTDKNSLD